MTTHPDLVRLVRKNKILVVTDLYGTLFDPLASKPLPGAIDLLKECNRERLPVMVSTDCEASEAAGLLNVHGVMGLVRTIVGLENSPIDSGRLDHAIRSFASIKTGIPFSDPQVVVIDDNPDRVGMVAKRGFRFIGVCTGGAEKVDFECGPYKPSLVVEKLTDPRVMETILDRRPTTRQARMKSTT